MLNAPHSVVVKPADTDPATTTAFGKGLVYGTAGVASHFTIQAKDSHGNNRDDGNDLFQVVAFEKTPGDRGRAGAAVHGRVTYIGDGRYAAQFTPQRAVPHTVAVTMAVNHERQLIKTQFKPTRLADGCSVQAAALLTPPATGTASPPEPSVCRQDPEDQHSRY